MVRFFVGLLSGFVKRGLLNLLPRPVSDRKRILVSHFDWVDNIVSFGFKVNGK